MNIGGVEDIKILGIGPQLDLGNFTVGLATIFVALVTLYIAISNTKSANNHKIAEFRRLWIEDLRSKVADFVGCIDSSLNYACSIAEGRERHSEMDKIFGEIKRLESYINLKLNPNEIDHRTLSALLGQARSGAAGFANNLTARFSDEIHKSISLIVSFSQIVLKTEWDRVRDETRGRRRLTKILLRKYRQWKRRKREKATRFDVASFLKDRGTVVE